MDKVLVRFNTKHEMDGGCRKWRVLVNGKEWLAQKVMISVPCETVCESVEGVDKYHFLCHGKVEWAGETATIL